MLLVFLIHPTVMLGLGLQINKKTREIHTRVIVTNVSVQQNNANSKQAMPECAGRHGLQHKQQSGREARESRMRVAGVCVPTHPGMATV